jgi:hypothetical protein
MLHFSVTLACRRAEGSLICRPELARGEHDFSLHGTRVAIGNAIRDRKEVLGLAYKKFRECAAATK